MKRVHVIGAGLAGSECAWQLANRGIEVILYEMRGVKATEAHVTENFAELVCSNSFRSSDVNNAVGLLHEEMRQMNSLIMSAANETKIPAGSALAVDREAFAKLVEQRLTSHPNVKVIRKEVTELPSATEPVVIASGPLTSSSLASLIQKLLGGEEYLAFFDAIAPIVYKESIDFSVCWMQSRYDKGEGKDYINCPLDKDQYYAFIDALLAGEKTEFKEWEKNTPYFNGCLPIEVMAERGVDTLRFGPMKPVGLTDPRTGKRTYAVVQLRQDNKLGTLYNIVGFQTKLKWGAQKDIFRTIPGLEKAEFARFGGLHRNTFINSPRLLDERLRLKANPLVRFAGQITGVEGYLESAACGLINGVYTAAELAQVELPLFPQTSALGALANHITNGAESSSFQPMNVNYGLFPVVLGLKRGDDKKAAYSKRALEDLEKWKSIGF
jgi:methylenetetrahydrofolate--tRNA-(uracil-5-)-methyltransferase